MAAIAVTEGRGTWKIVFMETPAAERMRQLRARNAAKLEAVPDAPEREPGAMLASVERSLACLRLGERDEAQAQLAREYAAASDQAQSRASALRALGPPLARVLAELARSAGKAQRRSDRPSRVAQLRAADAASPAVRKRRGAQHAGLTVRKSPFDQ
jgi:hypothetical protein